MDNLLWIYATIYFVVINLLSFFMMWYDKRQATRHGWRISEKGLLLLALFLGGVGIYAGIYHFRHKTKHTKFIIGVPVIIVLNILSIYYIVTVLFPSIM